MRGKQARVRGPFSYIRLEEADRRRGALIRITGSSLPRGKQSRMRRFNVVAVRGFVRPLDLAAARRAV